MFASTKKPVSCPWGYIQHATESAPGIWFVSTPSHGGFLISHERRLAMPDCLKINGEYHNWVYAFEEDCEAALVVLAFPEEFAAHVENARGIVASFYPEALAALDKERGN